MPGFVNLSANTTTIQQPACEPETADLCKYCGLPVEDAMNDTKQLPGGRLWTVDGQNRWFSDCGKFRIVPTRSGKWLLIVTRWDGDREGGDVTGQVQTLEEAMAHAESYVPKLPTQSKRLRKGKKISG